jgi:hypothetical protein
LTNERLGEDKFMLKEVDYRRIQMIEENGRIVAAKAIFRDGRTKAFPKTQ